jgi:hypothetical protein
MSCLLGVRGVILLISWIGLCWYYFFSVHYDRSSWGKGEHVGAWRWSSFGSGIQVVNRVYLTLHK